MVRKPHILILSSKEDFSSDYVVARLMASGVSYLRLNSEDLPFYNLLLNPLRKELCCNLNGTKFLVEQDTLRSVWYRRSVYLRDYGPSIPGESEKQIARVQWAAFMRGLMIFDRSKWVNHPGATYLAEQKPLQLSIAQEIGFQVPQTVITNDGDNVRSFIGRDVAIKGIDTVIAFESGQELFAFTKIIPKENVTAENLRTIPIIVQEPIHPKTDIRVTVVENTVFAAAITKHGEGISGDWRLDKAGISYRSITLPSAVECLCRAVVERLGLRFGAIDLALRGEDYFFLEINPTGEWAWLVDSAGLQIDKAIANALISG